MIQISEEETIPLKTQLQTAYISLQVWFAVLCFKNLNMNKVLPTFCNCSILYFNYFSLHISLKNRLCDSSESEANIKISVGDQTHPE